MSRHDTLTSGEIAFVQAQRVARLATAGADGRPHVIPVCYAYDGARFYTPLDEKPKQVSDRKLRRVRNIEERPEVALLIDRYDDDWSQLAYVLIRGQARILRPGDEDHLEALFLLRERYPQYEEMRLEARPVIAVTPLHVTAWGPGLTAS